MRRLIITAIIVRGCINGAGRLDFLHVANSTGKGKCEVFRAYLSCIFFLKDKLCCCIFKRRGAVVAGIFVDFDRYD